MTFNLLQDLILILQTRSRRLLPSLYEFYQLQSRFLLEGGDFRGSWYWAHRIGFQLNDSVLDEKSCRGRSPVAVTAPTILVGWPVWVYFSFCILFRIIPISIFSNVLIFYSAISNTLSVPYSAIFILEMFFISKSSIWLDSIHLFPHNMHVSLYLLFLKKHILFIMLLQLSHFPPFIPLHPAHSLPPSFPPFRSCPWVIYTFFGFYMSYTILTLPLSIFYLPFKLLILCTLSPSFPTHSPADNPPCDLHFCGSVPVLVVCLVCLYFCFRHSC